MSHCIIKEDLSNETVSDRGWVYKIKLNNYMGKIPPTVGYITGDEWPRLT